MDVNKALHIEDSGEALTEPQNSSLQEAMFRRLLGQYECNLLLLSQHFADIAEKLLALDLPCPLSVDEVGKVWITSPAYTGSYQNYRSLSRMYYETFADDKKAATFDLTQYDPRTYETRKKQTNAHLFHRPFEGRYIDGLIEDQRKLVDAPRKNPPERRVIPVAMAVGTAFGFHLNWMADDFDISHLIIVEPDLENLHLALFFMDLQALMDRMSAPGKTLLISTTNSKSNLSNAVINLTKRVSPSYMAQYLRVYYDGSDKKFLKDFIQNFSDQMWSFFMGWGFIDDEVLSVYYSAQNHRDKLKILLQPIVKGDDTPVFIVGSGPSLDGLIPLMKSHRDKILIVSCGTALSALKNHNIKPDLHVEIERTNYTADILISSVGREWLRDIPFIGTQLMSPQVYKLFRNKAGVLKESDTAVKMLDPDRNYSHILTNPTCTNGGLHLMLELGFTNIYLAGIDVGFAKADQHHAKSSLYYNADGDKKSIAEVRKITNSSMEKHVEVPGNFRKKVYSVKQFIFTRNVLSNTITRYPESRVFNLNDGARIASATPLRPSRFRPPKKSANQKNLIENIFSNFRSQQHLKFSERHHDLIEQLDLIIKDIDTLMTSEQPKSLSETLNVLSALYAYVSDPAFDRLPCTNLLSGGINILANICYRGLMLLNDDVLAARCFKKFHIRLMQLLRKTRTVIADIEEKNPSASLTATH